MFLSRILQVQKIGVFFLYVFLRINLMFGCLGSKIERQLRGPEPEDLFARVFTYKNAFWKLFLVFLIVFCYISDYPSRACAPGNDFVNLSRALGAGRFVPMLCMCF